VSAEGEAARIAALEADNARLRRLLDQRDAPHELRHRLRSTLGLLRAVVRRSATSGRELSDYVAHLEDRLDAISRAQAMADLVGLVSLPQLLADEMLQYGAGEGPRLRVAGPEVLLEPRAGQIVALALHELAVNSVEHGVLGARTGRVEVSWEVAGRDAAEVLLFSWAEHGPAKPQRRGAAGFGTEVLTRMLPYEYGGAARLSHEPGCLRAELRLPLTARVGRVQAAAAVPPGLDVG
jgi:two-component sensor histidine kinase